MLKLGIEPLSYGSNASTAYVVVLWPSFLFDSFVKIWATCEIFLGKWFTAPPGKKFPIRLCRECWVRLHAAVDFSILLAQRFWRETVSLLDVMSPRSNQWEHALLGKISSDRGRDRAFSHDVTAAILVFQNNEMVAMLVFKDNPVGHEPFSYVNTFICSNKFV